MPGTGAEPDEPQKGEEHAGRPAGTADVAPAGDAAAPQAEVPPPFVPILSEPPLEIPAPKPAPLASLMPRRGRVAAVDYGTVRLGIATADVETKLVFPLENLQRSAAPIEDARRLRKIADEHDVRLWVVGLPVASNGGDTASSMGARRFAQWLEEVTKIPIVFFDERFTSREAENRLIAAEVKASQRKGRRDKLAAAILLEAFMESAAEGRETNQGTSSLD